MLSEYKFHYHEIILIFMYYDSGMSILRAYVVKIFDEIFSNEGRNTTSMMGNLFRPHSNLVRIYVINNIY